MNMQELYDEMKEVLKFFDLRFSQMNQVEFSIDGSNLVFKHKRMSVHIDTEDTET